MHHHDATVPDHRPLTRGKLDDLITTARASGDWLHKQTILRVIDAGIEGMRYPRFCSPPAVLKIADEARELFKAHVNDPKNLVALAKLEALLGLESLAQSALPLGAASDWSPQSEPVCLCPAVASGHVLECPAHPQLALL